jgi:hypothetical protein
MGFAIQIALTGFGAKENFVGGIGGRGQAV